MIKYKLYRLLILTAAALAGCATTATQEVKPVWPLPPQDPKIAYLTSYRGEADFKKKSFLDVIFGAPPSSALQRPYGVCAAGDKIYVTTTQNPAVVVMDTKERKISYIGEKGAGRVVLPIGVAVAADGMVFVSDANQKRIFGYDPKGDLKISIGKKGEFLNPAGLAINNELKRLYVVDSFGHSVHAYSLQGEKLFHFGRNGAEDGEFHYPTNAAIDRRNGDVYIVDTQNFRVQVFDKDGKFIRKFGDLGDIPGTFSRPKGIGIDSEGHVYVADAAFNNFQIFNDKGDVLEYIGSAGSNPGFFQLPAGLYVDEKDRIFVVDSLNTRVQVFQYLSDRWKKERPEEYKKYQLP